MNAAELPARPDTEPSAAAATMGRWAQVERLLDRASDRLNPILVKETRQALKSRQFIITFTLLLLCGWGWSLLGVALGTPGILYAPGGPWMLWIYYLVLAFPLIVLVPFATLRSLAAERDEGTYDVLSITTLRAEQIVDGKLGSALLQMLVYLCSLSPCLVFTYLLRGVDILLILLMLFYLFLGSVLLSSAALLVASVTTSKAGQLLLSVASIVGLVALYLFCLGVVSDGLDLGSPVPYDAWEFWIVNAIIVSFTVSFVLLFRAAAAAQITFSSENRSTRLRVIMLCQYLLLVGWVAFGMTQSFDDEGLVIFVFVSGIYWYIAGVLMSGESGQISPRARRRLPQSTLGRMFLTLLNPGPGTGYFFAVGNLFSAWMLVAAVVVAIELLGFFAQGSWYFEWEAFWLATGVWCYVVWYLGIGRLVLMFLKLFHPPSIVLAVIVHVALLTLSVVLPLIAQPIFMSHYDMDDFTLLQTVNPFWTLAEMTPNGDVFDIDLGFGLLPPWLHLVPLILLLLTGMMLMAQAILSAGELRFVHEATPEEVDQEEQRLHPPKAPPRQSPWDEGEAT